MPHQRNRYIEPLLKKSLSYTPIVGILGQRQTGKTTLVEKMSSEYETLDNRISLEFAEKEPEQFLQGRNFPFGIDECQYAPKLFPELKEAVRKNPRKGQFILTGSVRFTSRKAIRESLTGRIFNLELLPLSITESHEKNLSSFLVECQKSSFAHVFNNFNDKQNLKAEKQLEQYLITGGLPGICFHRDTAIRRTYFETHLETLLDRDLRLIHPTNLEYRMIRSVLAFLAEGQGDAIDYTHLARSSQISVITIKKLISAFEGIFMIRRISTIGGKKAPTYFFEDQGLATHLLNSVGVNPKPLMNLVRGLFSNILPVFLYRPELNYQAFQFRTLGGAWVPFAFKTIHGSLGIIPCLAPSPTPTTLGSANSFVKQNPESKVIIVCSESGSVPRIFDSRIASVPMSYLL